MKCFIIDDEPIARMGLKEFIEQTPKLECIGEANNPLEAMPLLSKLSPDLLFLDIQMPHMSGIEFVNNFKLDVPIIYTTAYSNYAVECFDLDIEDYLLKPLQYDRFLRAIGRVYKKIKDKYTLHDGQLNSKDSFFVRSDGIWKKVVVEDIIYIKSIQNYVKIYLKEGSCIVHQTLKSFEELLPKEGFFKVQKSYIVNISGVDSFDGYLLYLGDHSVPVSRNKIKELKMILFSKET